MMDDLSMFLFVIGMAVCISFGFYALYNDVDIKALASPKADYTIQMQDTGKKLAIKTQDEKKSNWSYTSELYYDKDTGLVYYNVNGESSFSPYMKDSSTQYKWNTKSEQLE